MDMKCDDITSKIIKIFLISEKRAFEFKVLEYLKNVLWTKPYDKICLNLAYRSAFKYNISLFLTSFKNKNNLPWIWREKQRDRAIYLKFHLKGTGCSRSVYEDKNKSKNSSYLNAMWILYVIT